jgi:hypothetical protein
MSAGIPKKTKSKAWLEFEKHVAEVYSNLGAIDIQHDINLAGNQIDVLLRLPTGDGLYYRTILSCKCYANAAGVDDVKEWHLVFSALRNLGLVDLAVIVSKTSFSKQAKELAEKSGIRLLTIAQLERADTDLLPYVREVRKEVAQDPVFVGKLYIPIRLRSHSDGSVVASADTLTSFLANSNERVLLVLGD